MPRIETRCRTTKNILDEIDEKKILISPEFQRGDDETGVWSKKKQREFIDSFIENYPYGSLTFVKSNENAMNPWMILDGGHRTRAIRDFYNNKFKNKEEKFYSELSPELKSEFKNKQIPITEVKIARHEDKAIISEMFSRLNTTSTKLSDGELIKSMGWLKDIPLIEISKIWLRVYDESDKWGSNKFRKYNQIESDFYNELITQRKKWIVNFSEIEVDNRTNNLAFIVGLLCSIINRNHDDFTKKFCKLKDKLEKTIQDNDYSTIIKYIRHINTIIGKIGNNIDLKKIFKQSKGIPNFLKFSLFWKLILTDDITDKNIVTFYKKLIHCENTRNKLNIILTKTGDNHVTKSKLDKAIDFVKEICLN